MKRKISLILLIAILAGCVSCGDAEATQTETTTGESTTQNNVETSYIDNLKKEDFNEYEFNIFGEVQSYSGDYFDAEEESGDVISDNVYRRNRTVEQLYNVKLSFTTVEWMTGTDTIKNQILAGDNSFDLYTCTHLYLGSVLLENYFVDWQTVDGIDLTLPCYIKAANDTYSIGDKMPLLFGDFMETNYMRCWNFIFNKRLIEEYKLDEPYDIVESGKWTVDYLSKVSRDVYSDLNGDSTVDKDDLFGYVADKLGTLDGFTRSLKMSAIKKNSENLPELDYWRESTVTAFEKLYSLYNENQGTFTVDESLTHIESVFAEGRAVFCSTRLDYIMKPKMREMKDDYGVIPYPKLDESDDYATYLSGTFSSQMIGVTQPESDRYRTATITQALNAYSHEYVIPAIVETTLKTKVTRDDKSTEMVNMVFDNRQYSFDSFDETNFPLSPKNTVRKLIGKENSKDIASYYEANKAAAEAWVENIIATYQE